MFRKVTYLILLVRLAHNTSSSSVCTPNTQALLNGKICKCNSTGQWSESDCHAVKSQSCMPGKVIFQGCKRCVCQDGGLLSCIEDSNCSSPLHHQSIDETLLTLLPRCQPYKTYYVNCHICICPVSGKTVNARCVQDTSCSFSKELSISEISSRSTICIPNVMYLYPCLHCLCSHDGYFNLEKCLKTCADKQVEPLRTCIPNALYKNDCNVCLCPENGIPDDKNCTEDSCSSVYAQTALKLRRILNNKPENCTSHKFAKPRCVYCVCNNNGAVDEENCLELTCIEFDSSPKYDTHRKVCTPGEMVPFCTECFCSRDGIISDEYCSKGCSHQSKLEILEKIVETPNIKLLIDDEAIKRNSRAEACEPGTIYIDHQKYCLCPKTGLSNLNICTPMDNNIKANDNMVKKTTTIDSNITCEPSSFVQFDCNTCFCSKKGNIDPKWCTSDDCESKRIIQESHLTDPTTNGRQTFDDLMNTTCTPGSITNVDCNFCICSVNGLVVDRVCTKNDCSTLPELAKTRVNFACEPLVYYEVGCNICYCPRDGIKNVAMCTKKHCDQGSLRSDACVPGHLFSEDCNVCVCPPNGNKADKACTTNVCSDPWKKIYLITESILSNQITLDETRNLDVCFPGEEFVYGCKHCVCPDVGLRVYATCSPTFCEEEHEIDHELAANRGNFHMVLSRRSEDCRTINTTESVAPCIPGSKFITKCMECICPDKDDVKYFCRPLPENPYCGEADSSFISLASWGKNEDPTGQSNAGNITTTANVTFAHEHTRYACSMRGRVTNNCFICDCDGNSLISEHCYKNNATECHGAEPIFSQKYSEVKSNLSLV